MPVEEDTVPCKWCAKPTFFLSTKECNRCWEIRHRLTEPYERVLARTMIKVLEEEKENDR